MRYLGLIPALLAALASALPTVTIFDHPRYEGQQKEVSVDEVCYELGPPFSDRNGGIRSVRIPEGAYCEVYHEPHCRDLDPEVYIEDVERTRIISSSIRCVSLFDK